MEGDVLTSVKGLIVFPLYLKLRLWCKWFTCNYKCKKSYFQCDSIHIFSGRAFSSIANRITDKYCFSSIEFFFPCDVRRLLSRVHSVFS